MRVLFVDDEPRILDALKRMLWQQRDMWTMEFATGASAALTVLAATPVDVVVTDMKMPDMDGAALLDLVMQRWPGTVRIVLSGQADEQGAERAARVAHQFMSKPCDPSELVDTLSRLEWCRAFVPSEMGRDTLGRLTIVPSIPSAYGAMASALASVSPFARLVAVLRRDPGLMATVLRVVNTSFFASSQAGTRLEEALGAVGVGPLRSAMGRARETNASTIATLGSSRSIERNTHRARVASALVRHIAPPDVDVDTATVAALLHNVGESISASWPVPHPSHAVAAYLLGLWGFRRDVVSAVAHHRDPDGADASLVRLAAVVHVAAALAAASVDAGDALALQPTAVDRLGLADSLTQWRDIARALADEHDIG